MRGGRPGVERLVSPESVFALVADRPGSVWLDGGSGWTVLAWDPVETVTDGVDWPAAGRSLSRGLASDDDVPFDGGCIGYLGYGAGHRVESVPAEVPTPEPEVWMGRYDGGLCWRDGRWHIAGSRAFQKRAQRLLEQATPLAPPSPAAATGAWTPRQEAFEDGVERVLRWVEEGDCYQVNLTRPVFVLGETDPWSAYRRLRAVSPARFGAYLVVRPELVVLSNSPELFMEVCGGRVATEPIKGTRPRHSDPRLDRALAEELANAPKDAAELAMIVDLCRNDLGRVAVPGSVDTGPQTITSLSNVHHAHRRISARLAPGRDAWDALAASFPPGSVTGAPKVRACQRIAELEKTPRGVYCGAVGFAAHNGRATWSVAIRTAVWTPDVMRYHVGGGIVADSIPSAEWWETIAKGSAMATAFGHGASAEVEAPQVTPLV